MKGFSVSEFRPTIFFLIKFIGLYLVGNLLYGLYVTSFEPKPDPVTSIVSAHTATVLSAGGWNVSSIDQESRPTTWLVYKDRAVLSVYEGCNGINTVIIFAAFIVAFGPYTKKMIWFIPLGIIVIHSVNLGRISLLFYVSEYIPKYMYYMHKYFFTAILYMVIFMLWIGWVKHYSLPEKSNAK